MLQLKIKNIAGMLKFKIICCDNMKTNQLIT